MVAVRETRDKATHPAHSQHAHQLPAPLAPLPLLHLPLTARASGSASSKSTSSRIRDDPDRPERPLAPCHSLGIECRTYVALGDHPSDQMRRHDAALRVRREEDGVRAAEVVDPCGVREVCFVQSTSVRLSACKPPLLRASKPENIGVWLAGVEARSVCLSCDRPREKEGRQGETEN